MPPPSPRLSKRRRKITTRRQPRTWAHRQIDRNVFRSNIFIQRLAFLLGSVAVLVLTNYGMSLPGLNRELHRKLLRSRSAPYQDARITSKHTRRHLSLNLGDGKCEWTPSDTAEDGINFHKTVIAGYPSGDKRMVWIQMEALTGWPAIDSWEVSAKSNHPFIKTNYPHQAGVWGWGAVADQVVLVLRHIRTSMIEYNDIVMDQITTFAHDERYRTAEDRLYRLRHSSYYFNKWRDQYVMSEIDWYGWFVDYWMEGGLMRDVYTHKITTPEHWDMLLRSSTSAKNRFNRDHLPYDVFVGKDTVVTPTFDPHCASTYISGGSDISSGCEPVAVFSGERLQDYVEGPKETAGIAQVLLKDDRMGKYVISNATWDCIWNETIVNKKGGKTVYDRPSPHTAHSFSPELLEKMIFELTRLIDKYSGRGWNDMETANRVVELLTEHRGSLYMELDEFKSSARGLKDSDFLGPKTRLLMRGAGFDENPDMQAEIYKYLNSLDNKAIKVKSSARASLTSPSEVSPSNVSSTPIDY